MSFEKFQSEINRGFTREERNGVVYLTAPSFNELGFVRHGVSTRIGGVSTAPYESLNLSFKRTNSPEEVLENYRIISKAIGLEFDSLVVCHYCHGNNVEFVDSTHHGYGITKENELPFCDGVITRSSDTSCVSIHSDCGIIIFADKKGRAIGTCHSGWKGTSLEIIKSIITRMESAEINKEDIIFALGPAISGEKYEIKEDVEVFFKEKYPESLSYRDEMIFLDINTALLKQLYEAGIPAENVTVSGLCTYDNPDLLYSFRRDRQSAGAMGSFIGFKE